MGKLLPDTSVVTFYRRSLAPADSAVADAGENPSPALDNKIINIEEGEWVTLGTGGKAEKVGATPTPLAFPCWVGGRHDSGAALQITVLCGVWVAKTTVFDSGVTYTPGMPLTVKNGELTEAGSGEPIVAHAEGPASGADAEFPNGYLMINNINAGGYLP